MLDLPHRIGQRCCCSACRMRWLGLDPTDLDASLHRYEPSLVLCSRVTDRLLATIPAWIVLYPEGASMVIVSIGGLQRTIPDLDITHLLALVDESATNATAAD